MKVKPKSSLYKDTEDVRKIGNFYRHRVTRKTICFFSSKVSSSKGLKNEIQPGNEHLSFKIKNYSEK